MEQDNIVTSETARGSPIEEESAEVDETSTKDESKVEEVEE